MRFHLRTKALCILFPTANRSLLPVPFIFPFNRTVPDSVLDVGFAGSGGARLLQTNIYKACRYGHRRRSWLVPVFGELLAEVGILG